MSMGRSKAPDEEQPAKSPALKQSRTDDRRTHEARQAAEEYANDLRENEKAPQAFPLTGGLPILRRIKVAPSNIRTTRL
jgi:hypothetical protein